MTDTLVAPTLEQLTSDWLSEKLQSAGFDNAHVSQFNATSFGEGQMAKCVRLTLEYENPNNIYPKTLIAKLPSDDPTSRATGALALSYPKEVGFYNHLRNKITIPTPECYYASMGETNADFIILMEDMAPAIQLDQLYGCSRSLAEQAVTQLAGLHGPTWCDHQYTAADWLIPGELDALYLFSRITCQQLLPSFRDELKDSLDKDELAVIEGFIDSSDSLIVPPSEDLFSVVHLDYRLDNLLVDEQSSPRRITAVDWQTIYVGSPLADVAYFLGASMLTEDRRNAEREIVTAYHRALTEEYISIDWQECWEEYRKGSFHGLIITLLSSGLIGKTDRRNTLLPVMAKRHARHVLDLGADEFLS